MKNLNKRLSWAFSMLMLFSLTSITLTSCESNEAEFNESTLKLTLNETLVAMRNGAPQPGDTPIAGIAVNAGFNELVSALVYVDTELNAGLVDLFSNGSDQYTVFAPTDTAFQNLYAALSTNETTVDEITDLPAELVLDVLKYHVTNGRRASNSVVPKKGVKKINTLLGEKFEVNPDLSINAIGNTSNIVMPNISASNGIIHVIDAVLLPIQ